MVCEKKTYASKGQADKRAQNLSVVEKKALWSYQCFDCGKWHLTSKRPAKRSYKQRDGKRNRN